MENELIELLYVANEEPELFNFEQLFHDDFKVYSALSAAQGMELLATTDIQIIVSDQRLPDKTGIGFFVEVAQLYPDTVRILLTTDVDTSVFDALTRGQVYQYIAKPFETHNVKNILDKATQNRQLKKENEVLTVQLQDNDMTDRKRVEEKLLASQARLNETLEQSNRARQSLLSVLEDQRRTQQEINKLNTELEQRVVERSVQLKAAYKELEAFSYSISHDLRAPLRHITGFIDLFLEKKTSQLTEEELNYLNIVTKSANEMGELIDALLSFSKLNRAEFQKKPIDTLHLVEHALKIFEDEIKRREIEIKINPLAETYGDYQLIGQVWTNLFSNAIKYTGKKEKAIIEIGSFTENNETVFFIKDNGAGFNMKYVGKLFGVFQRLHKSRDFEGIGIGLANINRIIKRHGGRCWADGETDIGATFYFSLPSIENTMNPILL